MADFDPDAYLAQKTAAAPSPGGFDPDAYLAQKTAAPAKGPGVGEALARGAGQGVTLGFGDEINGGIQAIGDKLMGSDKSWGDLYQRNRDMFRREDDAAKAAHGTVFGAGQLMGGAALAPVLPTVGIGSGLTGALATGAINGAGMGAVQGLGESTAGSVGGAALDTAKAGATGVAGGLGAGLLGKLGTAAANRFVPALAERARTLALAQGRRAITGGPNSLTVKNDLPDEVVQEVLNRGGIHAGDTVGKVSERLAGIRGELGQQAGATVDQLVAHGVEGPTPSALVEPWMDKAAQLERNSLASETPGMYRNVADELAGKPVMGSGNLDLRQAVGMKQALQDQARNEYARVGGNSMAGDAKMDLAHDMKSLLEKHIDEAGGAADWHLRAGDLAPGEAERLEQVKRLAAQYAPTNKALSNIIGASNAAAKGAVQAEKRGALGLRDVAVAGPMLAAAITTGNPLPLAVPVAGYFARTRGSSTIAAGANGLATRLGKVGTFVATDPAKLGKFGGALSNALRTGGQQGLAAADFVLRQTNSEYQKHVDSLPDPGTAE